jgi:hypothetical protein
MRGDTQTDGQTKMDIQTDTDGYRDRQQGNLTSLLSFFQCNECRLKTHLKEIGFEVVDSIQLAQDDDRVYRNDTVTHIGRNVIIIDVRIADVE